MGSLVVTRKDGETIHIGDDVMIEIVEINGGRAKVRIVAPKSVDVLRGELLDNRGGQDVPVRTMRTGQGRGPRRAA